MTISQKVFLVVSYGLALAAVVGWAQGSETLVLVGGGGSAVLTVLFVLGGGLRPHTPILAFGLGAWLIGGLQGALIGNALSVVLLESFGLLRVFTTKTISADEALQRADLERAFRQ